MTSVTTEPYVAIENNLSDSFAVHIESLDGPGNFAVYQTSVIGATSDTEFALTDKFKEETVIDVQYMVLLPVNIKVIGNVPFKYEFVRIQASGG